MRKYFFIATMIILSAGQVVAQQTNKLMLEGNKLYQEKKYKEAAADYQEALLKNPTYSPGLFNLGNSLYQQKQLDASRQVFTNTAKLATDKGGKAAANYNIGNTYMQEQKWEDAVSAYKHALRNNPQDADAKYNLSYAEQMMKQQQQQKDKDKKDQKKDQQNKQDKKQQQDKDKDKKDPNKDKQDKGDQDKDKKDDQQQQPQSQPSKLSQQQADQLLNALQQEEKKLQDKMDKQKGVPVKMAKDW